MFENDCSGNRYVDVVINNYSNNSLLRNNAKLKYYDKKHLEIIFYTGKKYEILYTFSILICWLILLDFIFLNIYINYIKYQNTTNNRIILYKYYFGSNNFFVVQRRMILKYFLAENVIIIIIYLIFRLDILYNYEVIKQLGIIAILNLCHSIIRYYIVNKMIQKIKINL